MLPTILIPALYATLQVSGLGELPPPARSGAGDEHPHASQAPPDEAVEEPLFLDPLGLGRPPQSVSAVPS